MKKPTVTYEGVKIPFTYYQLVNAEFCLKIIKSGMTMRGANLKSIRLALGLKGKNTADCLEEVQALIEKYKQETAPLLNTNPQ